MPTTVEDVTAKTATIEIESRAGIALKSTPNDNKSNNESETKVPHEDKPAEKNEEKNEQAGDKEPDGGAKEEKLAVEVEAKTGVSFPVKLADGKQLKTLGLRKKSMLGMGIKIYAFGIYADDEKLKDLMKSKVAKAPSGPTKEMHQMVVDSDVGITVRLVIVFSNLTMSMVRKNFNEGLGAAIKKLTGGKNEELTKRVMGEASDDIKLNPGSVIEISRLPGFTLQTKVKDKIVSTVQSELLCRAYMYLYLGEDPFDKEAKEKFGTSLLSLF